MFVLHYGEVATGGNFYSTLGMIVSFFGGSFTSSNYIPPYCIEIKNTINFDPPPAMPLWEKYASAVMYINTTFGNISLNFNSGAATGFNISSTNLSNGSVIEGHSYVDVSGLNHAMHPNDGGPGDPPKKNSFKLKDVPVAEPTEFGMGLMEWVEGGGIIKGGEKVYEVYQLVNKETKVVEYIGKTSQGMMKRFNQHLLDPAKEAWIKNVEPILFKGNLTRFEAKYYEQTQIMSKGINNLYNRINAVAEKYWAKYGIK